LHQIFVASAVIMTLAIILHVTLRAVPLRGRQPEHTTGQPSEHPPEHIEIIAH
jgi:hypothetical protein